MKVGILTFHFAHNYGAVLQAWGLQQALESLGHEVCIINYIPEYMEARSRRSIFRGWGLLSGSKFFETFSARVRGIKRKNLFEKFTASHLKLSPKLKDKTALRDFCCGLDAVITGSDQVWNLNWQQQFDDTYFLGFLKDGDRPKKIAYGACFGQETQPEQLLAQAITAIRRFDSVGMRNRFGLDILEKAGGFQPSQIVDPAFFIPTKERGEKHNQVTLYAVGRDGHAVCLGAAKQAVAQLDAPLVQLQSETNFPVETGAEYLPGLSPTQWVDALASSRFICSESFHGAVFALANKVPFIASAGAKRSIRVRDLLGHYGFSERFLESDSDFRPEMLTISDAYYQKLREDIAASKHFLQDALK